MHGTDKYTPFVTPSSGGYNFNMPSHYFQNLRESKTENNRTSQNGDEETKDATFSWEFALFFAYNVVRR